MLQSLISRMLLGLVLCITCIATTFGQNKFSPSSYIEVHKKAAQELMQETGVPASVILAVAIHESAYGNSRIAKHLNNHFGIKGKNNSKKIKSAYKGYSSVTESYNDFVGLLKRRKSTQHLFGQSANKNFQSWVNAIARSGYSQTKSWKTHVLRTISRYNLDQYDTLK
ncbi:glucosaminidase domain-containing protein [Sphingobacterium bovistauri]|uniref:Glucosaminidase domain-containing protein n=1 Tax=Sphingobacterium bovistauri TaxID=2781959 RepID=A0ABS7ZCR2_9SPHI|nr:glucosaminidase domain-containing protein [Sphingobacterium bovistauri]MCA5006670.1 glucosaminidase domain-containing protein [Sphingobacterium bovistauri]